MRFRGWTVGAKMAEISMFFEVLSPFAAAWKKYGIAGSNPAPRTILNQPTFTHYPSADFILNSHEPSGHFCHYEFGDVDF